MLINKIKLVNNADGMVSIPLTTQFSIPNTTSNGLNNFNVVMGDIINPIIDYEKIKLNPVNPTLSRLADSITFKLHFYNNTSWDEDSSRLIDIGFNEDDIKNKKKKIGESFIRLSFYDSNDFKTQNLLAHSTIYLDGDLIYSNYLLNKSPNNLKSEFICENPKLSNKIKSFEGFNIFLFKGDVTKTQVRTIYMRVDFNNAANGRSILFTNGKPETINGFTMAELYDNLFFEINCVYNNNTKSYVYYFIDKDIENKNDSRDFNVKNTINIDLYQAKVI